MYKVLHLKDDIDRPYESRKGGGRELASIEDYEDASVQELKEYIKKSKERLITAVNDSNGNMRT